MSRKDLVIKTDILNFYPKLSITERVIFMYLFHFGKGKLVYPSICDNLGISLRQCKLGIEALVDKKVIVTEGEENNWYIISQEVPLSSNNRNFVIYSNILGIQNLSLSEKIIFSYIMSYTSNGQKFYATYDFISKEVGLSASHIKRIVKSLTQKNYIKSKMYYHAYNGVVSKRRLLYLTSETFSTIEDHTKTDSIHKLEAIGNTVHNIFREKLYVLFADYYHTETSTPYFPRNNFAKGKDKILLDEILDYFQDKGYFPQNEISQKQIEEFLRFYFKDCDCYFMFNTKTQQKEFSFSTLCKQKSKIWADYMKKNDLMGSKFKIAEAEQAKTKNRIIEIDSFLSKATSNG